MNETLAKISCRKNSFWLNGTGTSLARIISRQRLSSQIKTIVYYKGQWRKVLLLYGMQLGPLYMTPS